MVEIKLQKKPGDQKKLECTASVYEQSACKFEHMVDKVNN